MEFPHDLLNSDMSEALTFAGARANQSLRTGSNHERIHHSTDHSRPRHPGVIVSQSNEPVDFRDRLACRVVNLVPVDKVSEAVRYLTVHTQTVGIYPDQLKFEIRDQWFFRGVQRVTDLGCAAFEGMANPHDGLELMRRMARWGVMESFTSEVMDRGTGMAITPMTS